MTNSAKDIRRSFLEYFARHDHTVVQSGPLVPHGDPTLLFTNAGMNQFKDVFLGREARRYTRVTTSQKCMRVSGKHNDLGNVGPSLRHHTFFEMLGNFSFGDYFKHDAIHLAWTLLTDEWKLPIERLYATVFEGDSSVPRDDEAHAIWRTLLPSAQVGELGAADNFWQMGDAGPCGRCSEIYYYRGADLPCPDEAAGRPCRGFECDCDRYIEIWNNVFMEFDRQVDGVLHPLPAPSIDTGMGLERITAVLQGHLSNYDTDLFAPILDHIGELSSLVYGATKVLPPMPDVPAVSNISLRAARAAAVDTSMRVVADHIRATTFLVCDGVEPSNDGRGYVLRKIMRRAMRHGQRLGLERPLLHLLVNTVVDEYGEAYPELKRKHTHIKRVVSGEENKFRAALEEGMPKLERVIEEAEKGDRVVLGQVAFHLYETYGLPRDFIEDMIEERALTLDSKGFDAAMEGQRQKARAKSKFKRANELTWYVPSRVEVDALKDTFVGYDTTAIEGVRIELLYDDEPTLATVLREGDSGWVVLPKTPFYIEAGGQVSDGGRIQAPNGEADVDRLVRIPGRHDFPRAHHVHVVRGELRHGDVVRANVDTEARDATRRNHTATHLLQAALRQVLGTHVKQEGSLVERSRLRFDFAHVGAVAPEQLLTIERIVNEHVLSNIAVKTEVKDTQEAIAAGAMAFFGEKYGDSVRVVSIPGCSTELCGGTHVRATGDIGSFSIASESGVSAGTRRIEAVTGMVAVERAQVHRQVFEALLSSVNTSQEPPSLAALRAVTGGQDPHEEARLQAATTVDAVLKIRSDKKRLERDNQQLRMKAAMGSGTAAEPSRDVIEVSGIKLLAQQVAGLDKDGLRTLVDQHRSRIKSGVVILASPSDGKVTVVVGVTADLTKRVSAGQVVKEIAPIVGGRGGGRRDFAEAGGKEPSKIGEMLVAARDVIKQLLTVSKS